MAIRQAKLKKKTVAKTRSKPTPKQMKRKNEIKRRKYAAGDFTVASVYFTRDQIALINREKKRTGESLAKIVRDAIDGTLGKEKKRVDKNTRPLEVRDNKKKSPKIKRATKNVTRRKARGSV